MDMSGDAYRRPLALREHTLEKAPATENTEITESEEPTLSAQITEASKRPRLFRCEGECQWTP